jgi:octaprenyl-diphosphate synthase
MNMKLDLKSILEPVSGYLDEVDSDIKEKLTTGVPVIDNTSLHLFIKGGKKIRAALVILAGGLKGTPADRIVEVASATEICHAATLVHDDIIDKSILRRGDITVSEKWGNKVAVLAGDFMYTKALDTIVSIGKPEMFPVIVEATRDMVKGELYQLQYSAVDLINREHYFNIIELKTARFMGACTKLGGQMAGFSGELCERLFSFGLYLGYAFQIVDDTLDVIDDTITGKDTGNDFMDGKVTLPFLHMLENMDEEKRTQFRDMAANPGREKWEIVKNELKNSGSIEHSIEMAREYIVKAGELLGEFPESEYRDTLLRIGSFFIDRSF